MGGIRFSGTAIAAGLVDEYQVVEADAAPVSGPGHHHRSIAIGLQFLLARFDVIQRLLVLFRQAANGVIGVVAGLKHMLALDMGNFVGHGASQPAGTAAVDAKRGPGDFHGAIGCGPTSNIAEGVALAADFIPVFAVALVGIELGIEIAVFLLAVTAHFGQNGAIAAVVD